MSVLCTWHDSWTTVACIKLWPYQIVRVKTKAKIFHRRFQLWKHKPSWNGFMITMAAFNRRNFQGDCIINISVTPCYKLYCHKTSLKINVPANGLTIDRKPCYYLNNLLIISLLKSFPLTHRGGVTLYLGLNVLKCFPLIPDMGLKQLSKRNEVFSEKNRF